MCINDIIPYDSSDDEKITPKTNIIHFDSCWYKNIKNFIRVFIIKL